jgi:hypothetical protein
VNIRKLNKAELTYKGANGDVVIVVDKDSNTCQVFGSAWRIIDESVENQRVTCGDAN